MRILWLPSRPAGNRGKVYVRFYDLVGVVVEEEEQKHDDTVQNNIDPRGWSHKMWPYVVGQMYYNNKLFWSPGKIFKYFLYLQLFLHLKVRP